MPGRPRTQLLGEDAGAAEGEQEVGGPAVARVRQAALPAAEGHPPVERGHGRIIEGDDPFGGEFAEWHLQPGPVPGEVPEAVQIEVEQLAQTQAGAAEQG